jgi:hypothetical protein
VSVEATKNMERERSHAIWEAAQSVVVAEEREIYAEGQPGDGCSIP